MNFSHHILVRRYPEQFSSRKSSYLYNIRNFIVVIYLRIPERKLYLAEPHSLSRKRGKCSFDVVVEDGGETNRIVFCTTEEYCLYFARVVSWFCSLTPLFGGVLHDVAVVKLLVMKFSLQCGFSPNFVLFVHIFMVSRSV